MNQKKSTIILSVIAIFVTTMTLFVAWQNSTPSIIELLPSANEHSSATTTVVVSSDESGWKTYENTKYGYTFIYPPEAVVQKVAEMERANMEESNDIDIFIPGDTTLVRIVAWIPYVTTPQTIKKEHNDIIALPLSSFAEILRQWQIEDKNPNIKKEVGSLEKITFKGKVAYRFTLTGSFTYGPWPSGGGYTLPGGSYDYIIFEHNNIKFVMNYPLENNLSQKLLRSFEFTK